MEFSFFESDAFGLNVYRDDGRFLEKPTHEFSKFIEENKIDIIRFSIDAKRADLLELLNSINYPISFNGTIINYSKNTKVKEIAEDFYPCELVDCNTKNIDELAGMVEQVFAQQSLGYSSINTIKNKVTFQSETKAIRNFIVSLIGKENAGVQFLYDTNLKQNMGFATYSIIENYAFRAYAGIIDSYRNSKYYEQLILNMIRYNFEKNIAFIKFGVKATNIPMVNKYNRVGCIVESINQTFILTNFKK